MEYKMAYAKPKIILRGEKDEQHGIICFLILSIPALKLKLANNSGKVVISTGNLYLFLAAENSRLWQEVLSMHPTF